MLGGEGAVCWNPILGIMRLLQWITHTSMACCIDLVALPIIPRWIEFNFHQFIHILEYHHVAVQLYNSIILLKREWCQLAPAVIEAGIIAEVFVHGRKKVVDFLLGDPADIKSLMAFWREAVGVEGNQRVLSSMLLEGVIEGQEAGEISCVGYEGCPYCDFVLDVRQSGAPTLHVYLFLNPRLERYQGLWILP